MTNKLQAIETIATELLAILRKYHKGELSYQIVKLQEIVEISKSNDKNKIKEQKISSLAEDLYPSRGGLTDFHVWKQGGNERVRINKQISELNDRLWNLVMGKL